jgi:cytochrome c oxidase subunit III
VSSVVEISPVREDQLKLGLWMFLATVTMLFAAFASAYVVRRSGSDWLHVPLPSILWWNTLVLAASSVAVEVASYVVQAFRPASPGKPEGLHYARVVPAAAMFVAFALGVVFLAGQAEAWRQLRDAGVYLPTSPHSSFFFMLTGAHAVHVVAALAVLGWGAAGAVWIRDPRRWALRMTICRTFWHYLGGVWLFLFALVSLY